MKLHYYIKDNGGIGREFVIWDDEAEPETSDGFKLDKTVELDADEIEFPLAFGARYLKDT